MNISAWSMDMVSSLDCFHPSEKSHALTAVGGWMDGWMDACPTVGVVA